MSIWILENETTKACKSLTAVNQKGVIRNSSHRSKTTASEKIDTRTDEQEYESYTWAGSYPVHGPGLRLADRSKLELRISPSLCMKKPAAERKLDQPVWHMVAVVRLRRVAVREMTVQIDAFAFAEKRQRRDESIPV